MSSDTVLVVVVVVLVGAAGFLAMAETGLTRMGEARATALAAEGRTGGRALARQVRHPERFLGPLLLWALVCQLVAATLVGVLAERHLGPTGIAAVTVGEVILISVLAEIAPKTWAIQHHDRVALLSAPAVGALASAPVLRLLTRGLIALPNAILPGKGLRQGPFVSEAELLAVASRGLPEHAPFDAIIVSAAFPDVPPPLVEQLAPGGRLVQPIGPGGDEDVVLFERHGEGLRRVRLVTLARFVRLVGAHGFAA